MSAGLSRKPSAYLEKKFVGRWLYEPIIDWVAYDNFHHEIARAHSLAEIEKKVRSKGYVPRRQHWIK